MGESCKPDLKKERRNVVLTGLGRSGTTLVCHLLNKLADALALSEPISPGKFAELAPDQEAVADGIERFYRRMRGLAKRRGLVLSKHVGGVVPDNSKGQVGDVRRRIAEKGKISVDKDLPAGFQLIIKQLSMFTTLLPALVRGFPSYAIVRNPLPILSSTDGLLEHRARDMSPPSGTIPYCEAACPTPRIPWAGT